MNYLEKCIEVFKKNNRWQMVPPDRLEEFLIKKFEINVKRVELIKIAENYLNPETLLSFCDICNFGFLMKDIAETLNISEYMVKKLIEKDQIKKIGDYSFLKGKYRIKCNVYSIKDVIKLGESGTIKPKRVRKINVKAIETTPENLAMALYVINKSAKKSRDTKQSAYWERNHRVCHASKTRSKNLYYLKNATMEKMIDDGYMAFFGIHQQKIDGNTTYLDLYRCGEFTFHNIHCGAINKEMLLDSVINNVISAEVTKKAPITYPQAIALLEEYSGKKATGTYNCTFERNYYDY